MQGAQGGKAGWPWRRCPLAWDFRELEGRDLRGRRRSLRRLSGQERAGTLGIPQCVASVALPEALPVTTTATTSEEDLSFHGPTLKLFFS